MDAAPAPDADASDGFIRPSASLSGDALAFERAQRYAWETQEGSASSTAGDKKLHLQANPTEGAVLLKKQTAEAEAKRQARAAYLASMYGNSALEPTPDTKSLLTGSSSQYTEYDERGAIKGQLKAATNTKSKYAEDVHPGNHTSAFGSWWTNFQWGYACCHSLVRNSYCTGEEGRRAFEQAESLRVGEMLLENGEKVEEGEAVAGAAGEESLSKSEEPSNPSKKRTIQELRDGITEEEMEGYKKSRVDSSDPMAKMLGRDEIAD